MAKNNNFPRRKAVLQVHVYVTSRSVLSGLKPAQPSGFRPDETLAASFLNGFKNIPGKACVKRVHKNYAFVNVVN